MSNTLKEMDTLIGEVGRVSKLNQKIQNDALLIFNSKKEELRKANKMLETALRENFAAGKRAPVEIMLKERDFLFRVLTVESWYEHYKKKPTEFITMDRDKQTWHTAAKVTEYPYLGQMPRCALFPRFLLDKEEAELYICWLEYLMSISEEQILHYTAKALQKIQKKDGIKTMEKNKTIKLQDKTKLRNQIRSKKNLGEGIKVYLNFSNGKWTSKPITAQAGPKKNEVVYPIEAKAYSAMEVNNILNELSLYLNPDVTVTTKEKKDLKTTGKKETSKKDNSASIQAEETNIPTVRMLGGGWIEVLDEEGVSTSLFVSSITSLGLHKVDSDRSEDCPVGGLLVINGRITLSYVGNWDKAVMVYNQVKQLILEQSRGCNSKPSKQDSILPADLRKKLPGCLKN